MRWWQITSAAVLCLLALGVLVTSERAQAAVGDCMDNNGGAATATDNSKECPANPTQSCRDTTTCYNEPAANIYTKYSAIRAYDQCGGSSGTCKYCPPKSGGIQTQFVCATGFVYGNDNTCNAKNKGAAASKLLGSPNNICPAN